MLDQAKLIQFQKQISDLSDQPLLSPAELKARFDACPEELRQKHNQLIELLTSAQASGDLGFTSTAGIPQSNVQSAIQSVHDQLQQAVLGAVPDGSIGYNRLDQGLRDTLSNLHNALTNLQNELTTERNQRLELQQLLQNQINTKNQVIFGTYTGNGQTSQFIPLGFTPRAVFVSSKQGKFTNDGYNAGAFVTIENNNSNLITITTNGFIVYYDGNRPTYAMLNVNHEIYSPYSYAAFV